jgi:transcriptional regulator with XRE-family HTH domain
MAVRDLVVLDAVAVNHKRILLGLSRKALAARAGCSVTPVLNAVAGRPVSLAVASRLATTLGLRLERLIIFPGAGDAVDSARPSGAALMAS